MLSQLTAVDLLVFLVALLLAVGTHEAMHAFAAHRLGDTTASDLGRVSLNPLRHIDVFLTILLPMMLILLRQPPFFVAKPVPFNPHRVKYGEYGAALVGIAGPLTNLALAGMTALAMRVFGVATGTAVFSVLALFIQINIGLFVFNMIPFPPLDGSRLLYAFAPEPLQRLMYQLESAGFVAIILFMFLLFPVLAPAVATVSSGLYDILL